LAIYSNRQPFHKIMAYLAASLGTGLVLWAVSIAVDHEGDYWGIVPFGGLALVLIVDSVALFLGKNWGRIVLSVTLHCLVLYLIVVTVLEAHDAFTVASALRRVAVLIVPILCLSVLIVAIHSGISKGPEHRRDARRDPRIPVPSGVGSDDVR
jgi:hypothetical protein